MLKANWLPQGAPDLIWEALAGDWNVWGRSGLEAVTFTSWQHGPWGCHLHITLHHPGAQPHSGKATTLTRRLVGSTGEGQAAAVGGQLSSTSHPPAPVSSARQTHGSAGGGGETLSSLQ